MNKSPAFQFYPKDWLSDLAVTRMTNQQRGIYITLLCHCWLEGSIPKDLPSISRIIGESVEDIRRHWLGIECCFKEVGGSLVNSRLNREREKQEVFRKAMRDSALRRWKDRKRNNKKAMRTYNKESIGRHKVGNALPFAVCSLPSSSSSSKDLKNKETSFEVAAKDETFKSKLSKAYPNVKIETELEKMRAWVSANPLKAKKNWRRFINSWIARSEKEKPNGRPRQDTSQYQGIGRTVEN